ncbi:hypothetical protein U1Q18_005508 [Sarracenia purpurea var. burkii]
MQMEDYHSRSTSPLSSQLLCGETQTCFDEEDDFILSRSNYTVSDTDEDEFVQRLLDREISDGLERRQPKSSRIAIADWTKCARLDAIAWILKTRALFEFRYETAYLSVIYFDRFLSRRIIDSEKHWAIRLLSLACLSLAAKMEECRVPALSEFSAEEYNFDGKVIQRMELLVLNILEWRMSSITPFSYIRYFVTKLCKEQSSPKNLISRTAQLIMAMIRDVDLMDNRASVIAAAATLVALDRKFTRQTVEIKINAFSPKGFLQIEDVFSCYNRIQKLDMGELTIPKWRTDASENSSVTSALRTKRKSLPFGDCDQIYGMSNEKRQK